MKDPCTDCTAKCCKYVAIEIDRPTVKQDYENIKWYICHGVQVYIEDKDWYIQVNQQCTYLGADNRCTIYHKRPDICREYSNKDCHKNDEPTEDILFKTLEQFEEYLENNVKYYKNSKVKKVPKPHVVELTRKPAITSA